MKEMLGNYADGQIEFYKAVSFVMFVTLRFVCGLNVVRLFWLQAMEEWERIIPIIQRIRVDV